jgi:hypothetical protein
VKFKLGKSAYAEGGYVEEAKRLWGVLDRRLSEVEYVAGDYSIADIAIWPWISRFAWQTVDFAAFPHVKRWYVAIAGRLAVRRGWDVLSEGRFFPCLKPPGSEGLIERSEPRPREVPSQREDIAYLLETGSTPDFDTIGEAMVPVQENMAKLAPEDRDAIAAFLKSTAAAGQCCAETPEVAGRWGRQIVGCLPISCRHRAVMFCRWRS